MPQNLKNILADRKYLGVTTNLNWTPRREIIVCQVATFSPICISMTLKECTLIDKQLINAYKFQMNHMPMDAKHSIFLLEEKGGIGVKGLTRENIGAILRDIKVYISNNNSLTTHAILSSIEEIDKQYTWKLLQEGKLPHGSDMNTKERQIYISSKKCYYFSMIPNFLTPKQ
jgi:hypothetical protein